MHIESVNHAVRLLLSAAPPDAPVLLAPSAGNMAVSVFLTSPRAGDAGVFAQALIPAPVSNGRFEDWRVWVRARDLRVAAEAVGNGDAFAHLADEGRRVLLQSAQGSSSIAVLGYQSRLDPDPLAPRPGSSIFRLSGERIGDLLTLASMALSSLGGESGGANLPATVALTNGAFSLSVSNPPDWRAGGTVPLPTRLPGRVRVGGTFPAAAIPALAKMFRSTTFCHMDEARLLLQSELENVLFRAAIPLGCGVTPRFKPPQGKVAISRMTSNVGRVRAALRVSMLAGRASLSIDHGVFLRSDMTSVAICDALPDYAADAPITAVQMGLIYAVARMAASIQIVVRKDPASVIVIARDEDDAATFRAEWRASEAAQ